MSFLITLIAAVMSVVVAVLSFLVERKKTPAPKRTPNA